MGPGFDIIANRSSNHSLKGLLLRKTHLFIHKEKGQVLGLQCREKMYVYWRAGENPLKSYETLTTFPKVSQGPFFERNELILMNYTGTSR